MPLEEAFEMALMRHRDDGYKGELMLGYDKNGGAYPWFLVDDNAPLTVLVYGETAVDALRNYARDGADS